MCTHYHCCKVIGQGVHCDGVECILCRGKEHSLVNAIMLPFISGHQHVSRDRKFIFSIPRWLECRSTKIGFRSVEGMRMRSLRDKTLSYERRSSSSST